MRRQKDEHVMFRDIDRSIRRAQPQTWWSKKTNDSVKRDHQHLLSDYFMDITRIVKDD